MSIEVDREKCIYCGTCSAVCPQNAITLINDMVVVDDKKCVDCGICAKACPTAAITLKKKGAPAESSQTEEQTAKKGKKYKK